MRIRMICETRFRSARATTWPRPRTCRGDPCELAPGRNSLATCGRPPGGRPSAPDLHRVRRRAARGRAGRWSASVSRSICSRISATNSAALRRGRAPPSSSSSTKPPREKIGVRSSCEALAMNSLRALSSSRQAPLHLVEGARQLAELVGGVDRDRLVEVAVGDLASAARRRRRSRREIAPAAQKPISEAATSAISPGDQDLALASARRCRRPRRAGSRSTATQRVWPSSRSGPREAARRASPAIRSTPEADVAGRDGGVRRSGSATGSRSRSACESAITKVGTGPARLVADRRAASPGSRSLCADRA